MKAALGLLLAPVIGVASRVPGIPLSAPPRIVGALLVVFMTLGFPGADLALAPLGSGG